MFVPCEMLSYMQWDHTEKHTAPPSRDLQSGVWGRTGFVSELPPTSCKRRVGEEESQKRRGKEMGCLNATFEAPGGSGSLALPQSVRRPVVVLCVSGAVAKVLTRAPSLRGS